MKIIVLEAGPFAVVISNTLNGYGWYAQTSTCATPYQQSARFFENIESAKEDAEKWLVTESNLIRETAMESDWKEENI